MIQRARGDYFLFEHPAYADSWKIEEITEFALLDGVMIEVADQCMYGLTTPGEETGEPMPAKKPTKFMSNSWCILHELSTRCDKTHVHQVLMGGRGAKAAEYPDKLCRAICRGLANQKRYDASGKICSGPISSQSLRAFIGSVDGGAIPASSDEFPAHWTDKKHEPDGTAHRHIVVDGSVEEASVGQFTTGPNVGADLLRQ